MSRLPDRFDLWVRKARECSDPARQVDYVLGALAGLKEWHFLNIGTKETPQAAQTQIESDRCLLVFTDLGRIEEMVDEDSGLLKDKEALPVISIPTPIAMAWCVECRVGLLVNAREDADTVLIPFDQVQAFHTEWSQRGGRQASGFWIPNMTTQEEDFWQEHGY
jgi:hypothetical protein